MIVEGIGLAAATGGWVYDYARQARKKAAANAAAKDRGEWCGRWGCPETSEHQHGAHTYLSRDQFKEGP